MILKARTEDGEEVIVQVHDLNEFFHAESDDLVFVSHAGSQWQERKGDLTLERIED